MSNQGLARHSGAEGLHQQGLAQEISGDLGGARELFLTALDSIGDKNINSESPVGQSLRVQRARIHRDLGFTYVRAAVAEIPLADAETTPEAFRVADSHLLASRLITGRCMDNIESFAPKLRQGVEAGNAIAELFAEHGATIGLQARMGTAEQAIKKNSEPVDYESVQLATRRYSLANIFLRDGNNGYYLVSNPMNAARHARIFGGLVSPWLARAESGLAWTAAHDRENLRGAALTNGSRMRFLLTRSKAIQSVITAP